MSGKFVRASKFRHVFGQAAKKELCYENLKPTISAFDSNIVQSNGKFISLNANGIGSFSVIPVNEVGKAPDHAPMFRGHTGGSVLDTAFDPFDENRIVSCGEDGKIHIWEIPQDYTYYHADPENIVDVHPIATLTGHTRKVGHLQFNPVAKDVLASSSFDYSVKIWDVKEGKCKLTLQQKDLITSFAFNYNGTKIVTSSRDKKIRVWDVRTGELLTEGPGHAGAKASRVVWLGNTNRIASTGFDRFSERQVALWDSDDISKGCIGGFISIDSSSGTLMPFFDPSTNLLFIAGKGDGNVRYFEFADDDLHLLAEYPSVYAQRGFAVSPKRYVNVRDNEIVKAFKLLNDNSIEPLSFIVPRRAEMFQEDIYPDAPAGVPAMTSGEFFSGKTVDGPILCSMRDIYEGIESPALSKSQSIIKEKKEEPKEEKKEEPKDEPKEEPKEEPKDEPRNVFTHSQEQGTENMLKEPGVNKLLEKVNDLSDDDTQEVDADDNDEEWATNKLSSVTPSTAPTSTKSEKSPALSTATIAVQKETQLINDASTTASAASAVKEEESKPNVESVVSPVSPETATTTATTSASTTSSKIGAAAGGLKANIEKLQQLVESLESNVEKLIAANSAKDERLVALEAKIDLLLQK